MPERDPQQTKSKTADCTSILDERRNQEKDGRESDEPDQHLPDFLKCLAFHDGK